MDNITATGIELSLQQNCILHGSRYQGGSGTILHGLILLSLTIPTLILNFLVLYSIAITKSLQTVSNMIVVFLAFSDIFTGGFSMPFNGFYFITSHSPSCNLLAWSTLLSCSMFLLTIEGIIFIATDRYVAIFHPFLYVKWFTNKNLSIIMVLSIISSIGLSISYVLLQDKTVLRTIAAFLIAIMICWTVIVHIMSYNLSRKFRIRDLNQIQNGCNNDIKIRAQQRKSMNTVFIILCGVLVCYLPYEVFVITYLKYTNYSDKVNSNVIFAAYTTVFLQFNSFLNPLIYCWRLKVVRKRIFQIVENCGLLLQKRESNRIESRD